VFRADGQEYHYPDCESLKSPEGMEGHFRARSENREIAASIKIRLFRVDSIDIATIP